MSDLPVVMTVKDLQQALKTGRDNAYALLDVENPNHIPSFKVGNQYRVFRNAFITWLEAQSGIESASDTKDENRVLRLKAS